MFDGTDREVYTDDIDALICPTYTMKEAAEALGKTMLTLKSWIRDSLVPSPVLKDTSRNYFQYSEGELEIIGGLLDEHFKLFKQLQKSHTNMVQRMHDDVAEYREEYV